jgi:hypothetical protein
MVLLLLKDPASRQRGRPTETRQQIPDPNSWKGSNMWSNVQNSWRGSNIWSNVHKLGSTPRHTDCLPSYSDSETRPIVKEGASQSQDNRFQTETLEKEAISGQTSTTWARHQDILTVCQVTLSLRHDLSSKRVPHRDRTNSRAKLLKRKQYLVTSPRVGSTPRHTDWLSAVKWLWLCYFGLTLPLLVSFFQRHASTLAYSRHSTSRLRQMAKRSKLAFIRSRAVMNGIVPQHTKKQS